jgi:ABC-2 type transport system permease protein
MTHTLSRIPIILAIIKKDLKEFLRDILFSLLSALALTMYIVLFWLMPATVDEKLTLGVHHVGLEPLMATLTEAYGDGVIIKAFPSCPDLIRAVSGQGETADKVSMGICFPEDFRKKLETGGRPTLQVYAAPEVPPELRRTMSGFAQEIAYAAIVEDLAVTLPQEEAVILGRDRSGDQIPFRDRMLPFLVVLVLFTESLALASLISSEVHDRTLAALRVTPAGIGDILSAKALFGTLLAFVQALVLLIAVGAWGPHRALLAVFMLLGAIMASGVGMLIGAAGKDFVGTLLLGILCLVPLTIPAVATFFPGTVSVWVKALPSYGVVQGIMGLTALDWDWEQLRVALGLVCLWDLIILGTGLKMLRHRGENP